MILKTFFFFKLTVQKDKLQIYKKNNNLKNKYYHLLIYH